MSASRDDAEEESEIKDVAEIMDANGSAFSSLPYWERCQIIYELGPEKCFRVLKKITKKKGAETVNMVACIIVVHFPGCMSKEGEKIIFRDAVEIAERICGNGIVVARALVLACRNAKTVRQTATRRIFMILSIRSEFKEKLRYMKNPEFEMILRCLINEIDIHFVDTICGDVVFPFLHHIELDNVGEKYRTT